MADQIQIRRDIRANWASANPKLAGGEIGLILGNDGNVTGSVSMKVGDGYSYWNDLPEQAFVEPDAVQNLSGSLTSVSSSLSESLGDYVTSQSLHSVLGSYPTKDEADSTYISDKNIGDYLTGYISKESMDNFCAKMTEVLQKLTNNAASISGTYNPITGEYDYTAELTLTGTSQPSGGLLPNVMYDLGTLSDHLIINLAGSVTGGVNRYYLSFDIGDVVYGVALPSGVTWANGNAPILVPERHYEISIVNNVATSILPNVEIPTDEIWYTTIDGQILQFDVQKSFGQGVTVVDNKYNGNVGIIKLSGPATEIEAGCFYHNEQLYSMAMPNSITFIGNDNFNGCSALVSVAIPDSVAYIGRGAFNDCTDLISVAIPTNDVKITIDEYAFSSCAGLISATIGNSVTGIGEKAFKDCTGLKSVAIPDSVKTISDSVFSNCIGLDSVTIGKNVTDINDFAFSNCTGLESITSLNPTPPEIVGKAFEGVNAKAIVVYVTDSTALSAYIHDPLWSTLFENIQVIQ